MSDRKPVDYDELFPGRFLKAGELRGEPRTLTIRSVDKEDLPQDNGTDRIRGIISFQKTKKQWVLNSTNGQCLKAMFGPKVQDWVGKRVTLVPETAKFGRETVPCVRVKGSPDIPERVKCIIKLPRKKDIVRWLEAVGAAGTDPRPDAGSRPEGAVDPDDEPDYDREPGED